MAGSIEKRGENSYRLVVSGGTGPGGKRKKYSKTIKVEGKSEASRLDEVEKELAKFITAVNSGNYIEPSKLTLEQYAEKWIESYAKVKLAPKTIYDYERYLKLRIIPTMGHLKISKIKPIQLVDFYKNLMEDGIRVDHKKKDGTRSASLPKRLSNNSILHYHRLLYSMFQTAVKWEMLPSNPAAKASPPDVSRKEAAYYEEEDITAMFKCLDKELPKYKTIVYVALASGLRLGELMALKWSDIDTKKNTIKITKANQYLPKRGTFEKGPKTNSSIRTITLPASVMELLVWYKARQNEQRLKCGDKWHDTEYLFTQWDGVPMNPQTPSKWFPKFIKKYGLKIITFHQLRHTSATILINAGVNIKELSARLGHSETSTTLDIYSHILRAADKDAADKIEASIFKKDDKEEIQSQA